MDSCTSLRPPSEALKPNGILHGPQAAACSGPHESPQCSDSHDNQKPHEPKDDSIEPIAIIGLAFELPDGLTTSEQLWDTLYNGRSKATKIHEDRWNVDGFYREGATKRGVHNVQSSHLLARDIATFDAAFFGITVNEARAMDPQQRILLETAYRAFENAGLSLENVSGSDTSVFIGTFISDYGKLLARDPELGATYLATGTGTAIMANRLSWFFNLKGPSASIDTGCSASLLALHLACQSILSGESSLGLVGGCNLVLDPDTMLIMSDSGFLSRDGKSYSFDARANGYGRGEGSGVVIIKKLSDALRDGDTIRAVIRATDANQDGFTPGIAQPNFESQKALIKRAYRRGGLDMSKTRYFEAHGTGTPIGDPIEVKSIEESFEGLISPSNPLIITALKPNIGHLENASGVASLIKTVISLEKGVIPPIAGLDHLNPAIREDTGLSFAREATAWPSDGLRRASINSFGYGGTNVHVVLDDAGHYLQLRSLTGRHATFVNSHNHPVFDNEEISGPKLLVLTSADRGGIERAVTDLKHYIGKQSSANFSTFASDLSYTLSEKRSRLPWRSFAVLTPGKSIHERFGMEDFATPSQATSLPVVGFVFTGQGAQWATMGLELLSYAVFRESIKQSGDYFQSLGCGWLLLDEMVQSEKHSRLHEARISQPVNTALQIALVDLLRSWRVVSEVAIGHSSGEIAAAYCAGSLTKFAALKVAYYRGIVAESASRLIGSPAGMLAVGISKSAAEMIMKNLFGIDHESKVSVACINSPQNVTISGYIQDLERLKTVLEQDGIFTRIVKTGIPYHSKLMDQVAPIYRSLISDIHSTSMKDSNSLFFSSTIPGQVSSERLGSPDYWVQNLVSPVRFLDGMNSMLERSQKPKARKLGSFEASSGIPKITHIIEVGPHPALKGPIRDNLRQMKLDRIVNYSSTISRGKDAAICLLGTSGELFARGYPVNILSANNTAQIEQAKMLIDLPGYNFNHGSQYWLESRRSKQYRARKQGHHELLGTPTDSLSPDEYCWRQYISMEEQQWVVDHKVLGVVVYPAAGLLVMALEAARQLADSQMTVSQFRFESVSIGQALVVSAEPSGVETQITLRNNSERRNEYLKCFTFNVCAFAGQTWYECCRGNVIIEYKALADEVETLTPKILQVKKSHTHASAQLERAVDSKDIYLNFTDLGLQYGPSFQALRSIRCGESKQAMGKLDLFHWKKHISRTSLQHHVIHPAALDNILQLSLAALTRGNRDWIPAMVPTKVSKLCITPTLPDSLTGSILDLHARAWRTGFRGAAAQFSALGSDESNYMIEGSLEMTTITDARPDMDPSTGICYAVNWKPDIGTMSDREIAVYCEPQREESSSSEHQLQTTTVSNIIQQTILRCSHFATQPEKFDGDRIHLRQYVAFLSRKVKQLSSDLQPHKDWKQYLKKVATESPGPSAEIELTVRVAENLNAILSGEIDPLALLFSDDLLTRYYYEVINRPALRRGLENFVDLLGHKTPKLRVLEIGAGTGSASLQLIQTLGRNGDNKSDGPRFSYYCYTDISPNFFESARSRLSDFGDRIEYKVLNIEEEPANQGFTPDSFDIILAANVLHATSDLATTLSHVYWLLKPGGKLIMIEATQPDSLGTSFAFGLLPGWWLSKEPHRELSPLLTEGDWCKTLEKSGFSGLDLAIPDFCDKTHQVMSLIVSNRPKQVIPHPLRESTVVVVVSRDSALQQTLATHLCELLLELGIINVTKVNVEDETWRVPRHSTCVFLPELEQNYTWKMSTPFLRNIKDTLGAVSSMVWLADSSTVGSGALAGLAVGLSRVYKTEHPEVNFIHLSVEVSRGSESILGRLCQILWQLPSGPEDTFDDEYREKHGILSINRLVPDVELDRRVRPDSFEKKPMQETFRTSAGRHTMMTIADPGLLESFQFVENDRFRTPLEADEIDIEIHATGLNFRDVLVALGQVDDEFFGFECSGIVLKKGSAVSHLSVGDRVACLMANTFATTGRCAAAAAVRLPESLSMTDSAGLFLTAATAYYAMVHIGRLNPGESVLIHSGAGGLGQAAIQIAQVHNAVVYTTVGTTEKKRFLMQQYGIPQERIFSSRTVEFESALGRLTNGRGVDMVLNSLSGEALRASWRCVAPFGRFLETGKKDILALGSLPMEMFSKNVSFSGIDLAYIIKEQPVLTGSLMQHVINMAMKKEIFTPTPVHTFPGAKIENAFRFMQNGKSMGKIVIKFRNDDLVPTALSKAPIWSFDPQACYIIAGGLGGLGRSISKWMSDRGARNLILLSRRTHHSSEVQATLQSLLQHGVRVATPPCDISDRNSLRAILEQHSYMGPIKGCIQLSMVIREGEFQDTTLPAITESLNSKVDGSLNLDELLPDSLDFFIMFSSITGIIGAPGVAPYAMGNVFQDELARSRVSRGLKATSIDLGITTNIGYIAETYGLSSLQKIGFLGVTEADIHASLAHFCDPFLPVASPDHAQAIIGLETLASARSRGSAGGPWYQRSLFSSINAMRATSMKEISGMEKPDAVTNITATLRMLQTQEDAVAAVLGALMDKLAAIFNIDQSSTETGRPLHSFGLDSLVAIEIRNWFRRFVGADIAVFEILSNISAADLANLAVTRSEYFKSANDV